MGKAILDRWLERFGFSGKPFVSQEAGREDPRRLNEYFVTPPYFDEVLGDASSPQTTLIFAPRGGGKTAQRVMVDYYCRNNLTRGRILSVLHTDFSQVMDNKEVNRDPFRITSRHHADEILKQTVLALAGFLTQSPIALKISRQMPDLSRAYLDWFISKYYDYLTPDQIDTLSGAGVLFSNLDSRGIGFRDEENIPARVIQALKARGESPPARLLDDLSQLLVLLGFEAIYVLVDRVDEFQETAADLTTAVALIEPLVADLTLMELPRIAFKFFLPLEMEYAIRARPTVRLDRLSSRRIEWTDVALLEVLHKRLAAFSGYSSLDAVCVPELRGRIEPEMLETADGSPRNLIRLGELLLSEHCALPMPDTEEGWLINERAWEATRKKFAAEKMIEWGTNHLEPTVAQREKPLSKNELFLRVASGFPAPIAMVCRDFLNQIAPERRFKRLLDLFEVTMTFSAFVLIRQCAAQVSQGQGKTPSEVLGSVLDRVSPGIAVKVVGRLSGVLTGRGGSYYGRRFQRFYGRNQELLNAFLELRNRYAHGALQEGKDYSEIIEKHLDGFVGLFKGLEFLTHVMLVRVDNLKLIEGQFVHQARLHMGDNPNFPWKEISLPVPLECDKLWLVNGNTALSLHPLVIERRCEECGSRKIFFYNRLAQGNASYLSYNCGHRLETAQCVKELKSLLGI